MLKFEVIYYYDDIYTNIPLTFGKKYVAFTRYDHSTTWNVVNDYGCLMSFTNKLFLKVEDYRELQLQKLEL